MSKTDNKTCPAFKTKVGGQALIEGVMMLGPKKGCMAVRKPDRSIYTETWDLKERKWYNKAPFIRGCFNFVGQLKDGYKYINKSGEISGMFDDDEEPKKSVDISTDNDISTDSDNSAVTDPDDTAGNDTSVSTDSDTSTDSDDSVTTNSDDTAGSDALVSTDNADSTNSGNSTATDPDEKEKTSKEDAVIMVISTILGIALAVGLFVMLPTFIFTGIQYLFGDIDISPFRSLIEGILKIGIFLFYMWLTSKMKTMKRLYMYHGAEHKTIFCYENREELTVENVRKYKRFHPRCGTSFIFLTLAISILVYTVLPINSELFVSAWGVSKFVGDLLRIFFKLLFLPVVVGISYELIRLAGNYGNLFTRIISAPGLAVQRLTTKEPDDEMIEVAIASMLPVLPEDPEEAKW